MGHCACGQCLHYCLLSLLNKENDKCYHYIDELHEIIDCCKTEQPEIQGVIAMEQVINNIKALGIMYGFSIIASILILVIGWIAAKFLRNIVKKGLENSETDETIISFVCSLVYTAALAFVIIAALGRLGVQTASFVAVLGAAGLAVGLALQGSLSNFAAGFLLVVFKPFQVGHYIEGGGVAGTVEEISLFTTILKSPDNKKIIVPNSKMTADNIVNYSAKPTRRINLVASVGYNDDLDKVKEVLEGILKEDERILEDPAPTVAVLEMADSSVDFAVRPWVNSADFWPVFFHLNEQIKKRFDAEGITIPFPQRDVHLYTMKE